MKYDLEIVVDDQMRSHALHITANGDELRVTVSPSVQAPVLTALKRGIAEQIADAIDSRPWEQEDR